MSEWRQLGCVGGGVGRGESDAEKSTSGISTEVPLSLLLNSKLWMRREKLHEAGPVTVGK